MDPAYLGALRKAAITAASAATAAAAELLRFASEGPGGNLPFTLEDPAMRLADALQLALGIEDPFLAAQIEAEPDCQHQHDDNGQLTAACMRFLGVEATAL